MHKLMLAAVFAAGTAGAASAATIDFDSPAPGYTWSVENLASGNCAAGQCLVVNPGTETTLSAGGASFSLSGLWFNLLGAQTTLTLTANDGNRVVLSWPTQTGHSVNLGDIFANITSLTFTSDKGAVRVDNLAVSDLTPAPIPLPASAALLLAGLGAFAGLRRRKSA